MSDDTSRCIGMSAAQVAHSSAKASLHVGNVLRKAIELFFFPQRSVESRMYQALQLTNQKKIKIVFHLNWSSLFILH